MAMEIKKGWLPSTPYFVYIYARAVKLAHAKGQVVGEKSDYYVTLQQLEDILR